MVVGDVHGRDAVSGRLAAPQRDGHDELVREPGHPAALFLVFRLHDSAMDRHLYHKAMTRE